MKITSSSTQRQRGQAENEAVYCVFLPRNGLLRFTGIGINSLDIMYEYCLVKDSHNDDYVFRLRVYSEGSLSPLSMDSAVGFTATLRQRNTRHSE